MKQTSALLCAVMLSSCASIFNHSKKTVISTQPSGANITITDKNQTVIYKGVSPSIVELKASDGFFKSASYNVNLSKKGFPTRNMELRSELSGWYFGNILIGGLIGMVIVDPATGKMWKMPEDYNVELTSMACVEDEKGRQLAIVDHSSLPAADRSLLIPVSATL
jgi:hypothetical protein